MAPHFDFADAGGSAPFPAEVLGTGSGGVLLVAMDAMVLARAVEAGAFHLPAGVVGEIGSKLGDLVASKAMVRLRSTRGQRPPDDLDASAAAAWLATSPVGGDASDWLITDWSVGQSRHRTVWDYLDPAENADPTAAALQFILDGHPELPDELADAGRLLAALTPDTGSALDATADVLRGLGVTSDLLHGKGPLGFTMQGDPVDGEVAESWLCMADELPNCWLVVYAELPVAVLEPDLSAARSVVARINGELQIGALLIDPTGDTVMYRAATYLGTGPGRSSAIGQLLEVVHTETQACLAQWRWAWAPADES